MFVERLFSLRHAEALGDVDEVRVLAGTVVTPLARDLLKRRGIAPAGRFWSRGFAGAKAISKGEWGFAIESRSGQVEAIRRMLLEDWVEVGPDAVEAAEWVVDGEGRGAFVVDGRGFGGDLAGEPDRGRPGRDGCRNRRRSRGRSATWGPT